MAGYLKVDELDRDRELAVIKKQITLPGGLTFESPSRSIARARDNPAPGANVNEIPRQINELTVTSLESGTSSFLRDICSKFVADALNLVIFDLKFDSVPTPSTIRTISQFLHTASDKAVMLPTVKSGLLKDPPKYTKYSDARMDNYVRMMSYIIDQIESLGNSKAIIGTIPLMPIRFTRKILQLYFAKGIQSFAVDAGTKDIIINIADFRLILGEINSHRSLSETFLYACNLGYPLFEKIRTRADDFLGIFAYVDVLGGTFKVRGGPMDTHAPTPPPRAKAFSREEYAYEIMTYQEASRRLGRSVTPAQLQNHNQRLQLSEANLVRTLVGREPIKPYVRTKRAVDDISMERLESIARGVLPS